MFIGHNAFTDRLMKWRTKTASKKLKKYIYSHRDSLRCKRVDISRDFRLIFRLRSIYTILLNKFEHLIPAKGRDCLYMANVFYKELLWKYDGGEFYGAANPSLFLRRIIKAFDAPYESFTEALELTMAKRMNNKRDRTLVKESIKHAIRMADIKRKQHKDQTRKVEVLENGKWEEIPFDSIEKGMTIRMFEDTGEEVADREGKKVFTTITNTFMAEDGLSQVLI